MRHALHRESGDLTSTSDWRTVIDWLGMPQPPDGTSFTDVWNLTVAPAVGLPVKDGGDVITEAEWNFVVDMALARHA